MQTTIKLLPTFENPNQALWLAMHNCYSENPLSKEIELGKMPPEAKCGALVVKHLLKGNKGHYGILEHLPLEFVISGLCDYDIDDDNWKYLYEMPAVKVHHKLDYQIEEIYLKMNARNFLALMDIYYKEKFYLPLPIYNRFDSMITQVRNLIPEIIDWYQKERVPYLTRTTQQDL